MISTCHSEMLGALMKPLVAQHTILISTQLKGFGNPFRTSSCSCLQQEFEFWGLIIKHIENMANPLALIKKEIIKNMKTCKIEIKKNV